MYQKFSFSTALFSFLVLISSALVLYFIPGGQSAARVESWQYLGLNHRQWIDLHLSSGIIFIIFGLLVLMQNHRFLAKLLKNISRIRQYFIPVLAALALVTFSSLGAIYQLQPIYQLLNLYEQNKPSFDKAYVGNPPQEIGPWEAVWQGLNSTEATTAQRYFK